ncbi:MULTISPECIES: hypothetical protein [Paracoccus]|uniref:hypothetical protein n=1 Tax=Paracoccus TaxID=265 RepID=UPI001E48A643|nr:MULTISPECIES: hypothetical protein [Paracoccus]MDK8874555.1 hypothetical protein [Paracoccus sp. SSJ]UFS65405.1 hypothetical protein LO749_02240 [Paracoccus denitrificans]
MMPRNVLMLGNSHTAAPRIALRDRPETWPGFQPDVFAMPGDTIGMLEVRDGAIHPSDTEVRRKMRYYNGIPDLPLSGYDAFVVIGCLAFHRLAGLQEHHRSPDFPSVVRGERCRLISSGLVEALLADRIGNSPTLRLIRALAGLGQGPVLFMDTVFPSAECRTDPQDFAPHVAMAARGDGGAYHARYLRILHQALGRDAIHIAQPADTVVDEVFTAPEWMRGSVRMQPRRDVPHEAREYGHANPAYGARQLDLIVAALAAL